MAEFLTAYARIFANEGGYVFDKVDKGRETYCGISRRYYPNWAGWPIVDQNKPLKKGDILPQLSPLVKQFYKRTQWDAIKGDAFDSQAIATFICDWYVTSNDDAVKALQIAVGVNPDGVVGGQTIEATNGFNEKDLMRKLKIARKSFYEGIVAKDPTQKKFIKGWLNRVESIA